MARCWDCSKDLGWGNVGLCGSCNKKHDFCFQDRVKVVGGFYKGCNGTVVDKITHCNYKDRYGVSLGDRTVIVCRDDLAKIEPKQ